MRRNIKKVIIIKTIKTVGNNITTQTVVTVSKRHFAIGSHPREHVVVMADVVLSKLCGSVFTTVIARGAGVRKMDFIWDYREWTKRI